MDSEYELDGLDDGLPVHFLLRELEIIARRDALNFSLELEMDPDNDFIEDEMLEVSEPFLHFKKGVFMMLDLPSLHILRLHVIGRLQNWPLSFLTFWTN